MAAALADILAPHLDLRLGQFQGGGRFVDAAPETVRRALAACDPPLAEMRPNDQPPARWLVEQAEELGGLLSGGYATTPYVGLRVDAICVPRAAAAQLARQTLDDWPPVGEWPHAIDLALAEGWTAWDALQSSWEGPGRALLEELPDLPVFGLWWD